MDDDEVPTPAMMTLLKDLIPRLDPHHLVGFRRFQCTVRNGRFAASQKHSLEEHRQWRLFQPTLASFTERGHTPGFETPEQFRVPAPDEASMIHFDWVVHSLEERQRKILRYDAHTPGHGSDWRAYYLADTLESFEADLVDLPVPELKNLASRLQDRFMPSSSPES